MTVDGFQVLRCPPARGRAAAVEFVFDPSGELLEAGGPGWAWDKRPIRVRRFWDEVAAVGIGDLPGPWVEYWTDPD